jgi:hypothetical protein
LHLAVPDWHVLLLRYCKPNGHFMGNGYY